LAGPGSASSSPFSGSGTLNLSSDFTRSPTRALNSSSRMDAWVLLHWLRSAKGDQEAEAMKRAISLALPLLLSASVWGLDLSSLSNRDAVSGLKDALAQGSAAAIAKLGVENGFLGNDKVRIPLPEPIHRVEGGLRMLGLKSQADELETTMNRAAEKAVPEAKPLFVQAIRRMSIEDAKGILTGGDTSATEYFRKTTSDDLTRKFLPIVTQVTHKVGLTEQYDRFAKQGAKLGLIDAKQAKIEDYVTQKALDGLFLMLAEEEKKIRKDPVGSATGMARKVFDLLKQ
jgi:Protein of unknown function (DUF4197)